MDKQIPRIDTIAYGQNAEDIVLLRTFHGTKNGVYVDVGAGHPTTGSLTKNLHDVLQFRGVEIEPISKHATALKTERKRSQVFNIGLGAENTPSEFYECNSNWALSTFNKKLKENHEQRGHIFQQRELNIQTLDQVLEQTSFVRPHFELLKLDVEGYEDKVLAGFDIDQWQPQVIVTETTILEATTSYTKPLEEELKKHGYSKVLFDGINDFYLHQNHPELLEKISVAANKTDYYVQHIWWQQFPKELRTQYPHLEN